VHRAYIYTQQLTDFLGAHESLKSKYMTFFDVLSGSLLKPYIPFGSGGCLTNIQRQRSKHCHKKRGYYTVCSW
jgi:hypothetical protein